MGRLDEIKEEYRAYKHERGCYEDICGYEKLAEKAHAAGVTEGRGERDEEIEHLQSMAICADANSEKARHFEAQLAEATAEINKLNLKCDNYENFCEVCESKDKKELEAEIENVSLILDEEELDRHSVDYEVELLQDEIKRLKEQVGLVPLDIDKVTTKICKRAIVWCKKNKVEYFGDWLIAPVVENVLREELCTPKEEAKEEWNENVELCESCGIKWKKIGKQCPVCCSHNKEEANDTK